MVAGVGQRDAARGHHVQAVRRQRAGLGDRPALNGVQRDAVLRPHGADGDVARGIDGQRAAHVNAAVGLGQVVDGQVGGAVGTAQHAVGQRQRGRFHRAIQHQAATVEVERGAGQVGFAAAAGYRQRAAGQRQLAAAADGDGVERGVAAVAVVGDGAGAGADDRGQHVGAVRCDVQGPVAGVAPQAVAAVAGPGRCGARRDRALDAGSEHVVAGAGAAEAQRRAAEADGLVDAGVLVEIVDRTAFAIVQSDRIGLEQTDQVGAAERPGGAVVILPAGQADVQRGGRDDQRRRAAVADVVLGRIQAGERVVGADVDPADILDRTADIGMGVSRVVGTGLAVVHLGVTRTVDVDRERRQESLQQRHRVAFIDAPYRRAGEIETGEAGLLLDLRVAQADGVDADLRCASGLEKAVRDRTAVAAIADQRVDEVVGIGPAGAAAIRGAQAAIGVQPTQQAAGLAGAVGALAGHVADHVGIADTAAGIAGQAADIGAVAGDVGFDGDAADVAAVVDAAHQQAGVAAALDRGAGQFDVLYRARTKHREQADMVAARAIDVQAADGFVVAVEGAEVRVVEVADRLEAGEDPRLRRGLVPVRGLAGIDIVVEHIGLARSRKRTDALQAVDIDDLVRCAAAVAVGRTDEATVAADAKIISAEARQAADLRPVARLQIEHAVDRDAIGGGDVIGRIEYQAPGGDSRLHCYAAGGAQF
ncbi:hypothetical protein DUGA2_57060 [Duganella sp. HH101]|nr:hypothetical protein DUGA2_57060 [Duganella sp. HH101]